MEANLLERETGIEPATNSLEGCDSTTELLPPSRLAAIVTRRFGEAGPPAAHAHSLCSAQHRAGSPSPETRAARSRACLDEAAPRDRPARRRLVAREGLEPSKPLGRQIYSLLRLTASLPRQLSVCLETRCFPESDQFSGAGEGIRTPDLLITNQLLYRPELRQHKSRTLARPMPPCKSLGVLAMDELRLPCMRSAATPATFYSIRLARRWRTASKRATAVAVETFML